MATQQPAQEMIYHERQRLWLCAKHMLNNLLQGPVFTKADLDNIATLLAKRGAAELESAGWMNPHRSMLGIGDYDINVIEYALKEKQYDIQWFDSRKDPRTSIRISEDDLAGLILNIPNGAGGLYASLMSKNHWVAIKKMSNGALYHMDSKMKEPLMYDSMEQLYDYLNAILRNRHGQVFLVKHKLSTM